MIISPKLQNLTLMTPSSPPPKKNTFKPKTPSSLSPAGKTVKQVFNHSSKQNVYEFSTQKIELLPLYSAPAKGHSGFYASYGTSNFGSAKKNWS